MTANPDLADAHVGPAPDAPAGSVRVPAGRPRWARPGLALLLGATAVLYLWDLGASGNANDFYAAAVQAGTQSWKAMLFGSLDAGNAITVDKPALFLWPMEIAGRVFGYGSLSMLVPQALEGVAAVALLVAAVRRVAGWGAGLAAGALLALTPVAVLMFRFNNPDAMLVLLLVAASYALVRALETAATRWVTLAGVLVGLGFITKMGQALLVVPAMGLTYLLCAPTSLRRRITDLLGGGVAMVAAAGWWVATVTLWPAASRPYVGGSTSNSVLQLAFGYNGVSRLFGGRGNGGGTGGGVAGAGGALRGAAGSGPAGGLAGGGPGSGVVGRGFGGGQLGGGRFGGGQLGGGRFGGAGGGFGGQTGLSRLFSGDMATEVSWLLPTALLALVAGLWLTRRAPRTDLVRAALVLFGGTLLVSGLVFSYAQGTIHPYYTIALAPSVGALVAVTGRLLWQSRATREARLIAAVLVAATAVWDAHLLAGTPGFLPWLRPLLLVCGVLVAAGLVVLALVPRLLRARRLRAGAAVLLAGAVLAGAGGSTAWAVDTAGMPHSGSIPSSGPVAARAGGARGGAFGAGGGAADTALVTLLDATTSRWAAATVGSMSSAPLQLASGRAVMAIGGFSGGDASPTLARFQHDVAAGQVRYFISGAGGRGGFGGGGGTGSQISTWVAAHYRASTVGGSTVYDLRSPSSGTAPAS